MPHKKHLVTLTPEERSWLTGVVSAGKRSALTITRALILLKADQAEGCRPELTALTKQCLGRQIGLLEEKRQDVAAWQDERNEAQVQAQWQFTTAQARIKLHRLYPSLLWWRSTRVPCSEIRGSDCG